MGDFYNLICRKALRAEDEDLCISLIAARTKSAHSDSTRDERTRNVSAFAVDGAELIVCGDKLTIGRFSRLHNRENLIEALLVKKNVDRARSRKDENLIALKLAVDDAVLRELCHRKLGNDEDGLTCIGCAFVAYEVGGEFKAPFREITLERGKRRRFKSPEDINLEVVVKSRYFICREIGFRSGDDEVVDLCGNSV